MKWLLVPLRKTFDFSGRSDRSEFWMYIVVAGSINIVLGLVDGALWGVPVLSSFFCLALALTTCSLTARRLHDMGRSGWWVLLNFTVIGAIIPLVFALAGSDPHTNRFGPPPPGVRRKSGRKVQTATDKAEQAAVFALCAACGRRMLPGAKFCINCGAPSDR